jgi:hypothetical protein
MSADKYIRNERQFAQWFRKNYKKLGYSKIIRGDINRCPDFIMLKDNKEIGLELETLASNFVLHKHDIQKVDEVLCLVKDIELGKPIVVAKNVKHNIPITVSIKIDEDLLKEAKVHCIKNNLTFSRFAERVLKEEMKK